MMSKENKKISLTGSNENESISIVIDESNKKINIVKQNVNGIFQENFDLYTINIGGKNPKLKITLKDDNLFLINDSNNGLKINSDGSFETLEKIDSKLKTLESKVDFLESKVSKSTL